MVERRAVLTGTRCLLRQREAVAAAGLEPALLLMLVMLMLLLMHLLLLEEVRVEAAALQCVVIDEHVLHLLLVRMKLAGRAWPPAARRQVERGSGSLRLVLLLLLRARLRQLILIWRVEQRRLIATQRQRCRAVSGRGHQTRAEGRRCGVEAAAAFTAAVTVSGVVRIAHVAATQAPGIDVVRRPVRLALRDLLMQPEYRPLREKACSRVVHRARK